jgi:selenocysteine-specific elongation factor
MIVGTAGHIDHGKTTLVRALTGIDADRLPEEKRRGITIELGYAFLPRGEGPAIGFVDVPGHEKLVHTMVAGASGMDFALLLVAADDGVMPQTIEHLTVLCLLRVQRGAAVLTKTDKVDTVTRREREAQVRQLLAEAGRGDWPVLAVSAASGEGIPALLDLLHAEAANTAPAAPGKEGFRLPLDRVFSLAGVGTVVAGSIAAGDVCVGDLLCLAHAPGRLLRVRSLQTHGTETARAARGQRCAVGLAGVAREDVERGQVLCAPAIAQQGERLDTWLQVAATETRLLRSGTLVHLHLGTQERMATVAILGAPALAPDEAGLAQLVARGPLAAWQHDRFVLRDASAARTVAGGSVLALDAPARGRQAPERLAMLLTQRTGDVRERFTAALAQAPQGLRGVEWLRAAGLADWPVDPGSCGVALGAWMLAPDRLAGVEAALCRALEEFHAAAPHDVGPDLRRARRLAAPRMADSLWLAVVERMARAGTIRLRNGFLHLPRHGEQLRAADRIVAERALPLLAQGGLAPPWVRDIAAGLRLPEEQVRQVLARLAQVGEVYQVVKDLYYPPRTVEKLAALVRELGARDGMVTAGGFRDATGLGRKRAIQLLEFFDRVGLLRRVGDGHLLRPDTELFVRAEAA